MKKHIPNTFTSINLLFGWASIFFTYEGSLSISILLIVLAAGFDFMDGFAARMLNVQSELGAQLDSFADLVTFGIAPAAIVYNISNDLLGFQDLRFKVFLVVMIGLIPVFTALRLAKFNLIKEKLDYFVGLPSPAFALIAISFSSLILVYKPYVLTFPNFKFYYPVLMILIGLLMVSKWKFIAFKFSSYSFAENKFKYSLILISILLALVLLFLGNLVLITPIILLLYLLFSLIYNFSS